MARFSQTFQFQIDEMPELERSQNEIHGELAIVSVFDVFGLFDVFSAIFEDFSACFDVFGNFFWLFYVLLAIFDNFLAIFNVFDFFPTASDV